MKILFLVIFSALFLSGCPGKATPPQTTREEPPKYYKKCPKYIFYIHTICLIFFINGAHLGAELTGK